VAKAIEIRSRFDTPFPMDLIVRKPEFIKARRRERDMFIELVMTRGRVLMKASTREWVAKAEEDLPSLSH
jgi:hypothetical protein